MMSISKTYIYGRRNLKKKSKMLPIVLLLFITASCATSKTDNKEIKLTGKNATLAGQIIRPREGHKPFLTNRAGKSIVRHDLRDSGKREALRQLKFICMFGPERYHICKGSKGICRKTLACAKRGMGKNTALKMSIRLSM